MKKLVPEPFTTQSPLNFIVRRSFSSGALQVVKAGFSKSVAGKAIRAAPTQVFGSVGAAIQKSLAPTLLTPGTYTLAVGENNFFSAGAAGSNPLFGWSMEINGVAVCEDSGDLSAGGANPFSDIDFLSLVII